MEPLARAEAPVFQFCLAFVRPCGRLVCLQGCPPFRCQTCLPLARGTRGGLTCRPGARPVRESGMGGAPTRSRPVPRTSPATSSEQGLLAPGPEGAGVRLGRPLPRRTWLLPSWHRVGAGGHSQGAGPESSTGTLATCRRPPWPAPITAPPPRTGASRPRWGTITVAPPRCMAPPPATSTDQFTNIVLCTGGVRACWLRLP